jgi:hypothetical protein
MGTLKTTFGNVGFSVSQGFDHIASTFSSFIDSVIGGVTTGVESLVSGDVIGIDTTQIPTMQAAIQTYIDGLNDQLDTMESTAETSGAYKGAYAKSVTEFIGAVKTCCYAVVSQLLAFKDQLTSIQGKYEENDSSLASDISSQAGEMSSKYTAYDAEGQQ